MYRRARRAAWQCNRPENDCKHVSVAIMWNRLSEAQNHNPGRLGSQIDTSDMCTYILNINDSKILADMEPEIVRNPQSDWETPISLGGGSCRGEADGFKWGAMWTRRRMCQPCISMCRVMTATRKWSKA